eukprot:5001511-Prymnesium_polylepis.1
MGRIFTRTLAPQSTWRAASRRASRRCADRWRPAPPSCSRLRSGYTTIRRSRDALDEPTASLTRTR